MIDPCSPAAFEAKYRADPDPWAFASAPAEQQRYEAIVGLLRRERYETGYEPACSIGALTVRLAARCNELVAVDVAPTAVARTTERCRSMPRVRVEVGSVTDRRPERFDLVVLSEVGYYFSRPALVGVVDGVVASIPPGGELVACHWTGTSEDHVLAGATVHETIGGHPDLELLAHDDGPTYLLASWRRR
ncbi:MAG: SAM-dependent methyltransferase [Iamia sp.]